MRAPTEPVNWPQPRSARRRDQARPRRDHERAIAAGLAAPGVLRLAARVDVDRHGAPAVLAFITGWGHGYRRPDGVSVIPIAALAP